MADVNGLSVRNFCPISKYALLYDHAISVPRPDHTVVMCPDLYLSLPLTEQFAAMSTLTAGHCATRQIFQLPSPWNFQRRLTLSGWEELLLPSLVTCAHPLKLICLQEGVEPFSSICHSGNLLHLSVLD